MNLQGHTGVRLTECGVRTGTSVNAQFTGAPVVEVRYADYSIVPFHAAITYQHRVTQDADGWTAHSWFCKRATVTGHRVLKPGAKGEMRVSNKITHQMTWSTWSSSEDLTVNERGELPEFLVHLIEELRPSGEVRTFTL